MKKTTDFVPRAAGNALGRLTRSNRVCILQGPRQAGKSTLLKEVIGSESCRMLSGAVDGDVALISDAEAFRGLAGVYRHIVIDEAQRVSGIKGLLKRMAEDAVSGCRVFVVTSDSRLAEDLKTEKRIDTVTLWPLSLAELAAAVSWPEVKRSIRDRMVYGCLPAVLEEPAKAEAYLKHLVDTVLIRDIFGQAQIRKPADLVRLMQYLARHVGSEIRYRTISRDLGIDGKTAERYVELLEASFVVRVLPSFALDPASEIRHGKKIYFCDNGIRNAVINDFTPVAARADAAALWENLFFTERLKRRANDRNRAELCFWRTRRKHEVDFLEVRSGKARAYECRLNGEDRTTSVRAFERLYPQTPVLFVTPDNVGLTESLPGAGHDGRVAKVLTAKIVDGTAVVPAAWRDDDED